MAQVRFLAQELPRSKVEVKEKKKKSYRPLSLHIKSINCKKSKINFKTQQKQVTTKKKREKRIKAKH